MTVLVTRPDSQGDSLCQQLNQLGIRAFHHPLIDIKPGKSLPGLANKIHHYDFIIAVSQHAVTISQQELATNWPKSATYLAIGQKTAHILGKLSQQKVHYPDVSDSEHLLDLNILKHVKNKKVVILRGNGGRELISDTLNARGAQVSYLEVYQRTNVAFDSDRLVPYWKDNNIQKLVITSSDQLRYFVSQLTTEQSDWVFRLHLYVPSQRIAQHAHSLGFVHITNTNSAANKDLLAILQSKETGQ
ncbi:uroporphyrinogen-III synthase [Vibrio ostreicida]|uniref:Uroporphyrinogen-III synthase n=1 Tax=Vibrio ostreicida TaxID=526588 RepID=A0ABT8BQY3_9VIBR|nr:uroporphyrinogen-III synthase [Vibrio ostreicida]MDN3608759.1 uroporphyrinogen-III synthase [Vibrio ostreicida]NPD10807.1 uroporphyrinogen-III synthase [Vibrio ostreicida]